MGINVEIIIQYVFLEDLFLPFWDCIMSLSSSFEGHDHLAMKSMRKHIHWHGTNGTECRLHIALRIRSTQYRSITHQRSGGIARDVD